MHKKNVETKEKQVDQEQNALVIMTLSMVIPQEIVSGVQADSPPSERQQWGIQGVAGRPHPPGGSQKWEIQALRGGGAQVKAQTRY